MIPFRKYLIIYIIFKHFNNKLKLKKLTVSLVIIIYNNTIEVKILVIETKLQNKKIEILVSKKISIIFKPLFVNAISILMDLEVFFDNLIY